MFASESAPEHGSKAGIRNAEPDDAVTGKKTEGHVSATSESSVPEASASKLACAPGNEALTTNGHISGMGSVRTPTSISLPQRTSTVENPASKTIVDNNEIHNNPITEEGSHGRVSGNGLVQTSHGEDELWEQMKSVMKEKLGAELRKEQMQQTEQFKQQNQQLEERLQSEKTKVEQLKEQIQQIEQAKQLDKQKMMQVMDEMRLKLKEQIQQGEHLQQQNQMMLQMLDGMREHLRGSL